MKTTLLFVLMLLVAPACMAGQDWKTAGTLITAALDVDAQGQVVHAQLLGKDVLPQLQALTEQTTHDWQFVPATVDGKPAPARTYALLTCRCARSMAASSYGCTTSCMARAGSFSRRQHIHWK